MAPTQWLVTAFAQQKSRRTSPLLKERVSSWLKTCLQDWDTATHMSPREWEVTCQRVANERGKFLLENLDTSLIINPKGQQR